MTESPKYNKDELALNQLLITQLFNALINNHLCVAYCPVDTMHRFVTLRKQEREKQFLVRATEILLLLLRLLLLLLLLLPLLLLVLIRL